MLPKLITVAFLAETALAAKARVQNSCPFTVTLWSVGSDISSPSTIATGGSYAEDFERDPKSGGRALKITKEPDGLFTGKPQTIFAYTVDGTTVCYDLSDVFGDAFAGNKLVEKSADTTCLAIVWDNGVPPAGSQVKTCGSGADITLTLCA